jgi:hypothetical protein
MISDGETSKTKVVQLDGINNFIVENFLFEFIQGPKYSFRNCAK